MQKRSVFHQISKQVTVHDFLCPAFELLMSLRRHFRHLVLEYFCGITIPLPESSQSSTIDKNFEFKTVQK